MIRRRTSPVKSIRSCAASNSCNIMTEQSHRPNAASFAEALPQYLGPEKLRQLRLIAKGLFVSDTLVEDLVQAYQSWHAAVTGRQSEKGREKILRRLFGDEPMALLYLVDGRNCIPGFLAALDPIPKTISGVLPAAGVLQDPQSYLHPSDPLLTQTDRVAPARSAREALLLRFSTRHGELLASSDIVHDFAVIARSNPAFIAEQPSVQGPLRSCLSPLLYALDRSRPVSAGQKLLTPQRIIGTNCAILRYRNIALALDDKNNLLACFPAAQPGLAPFLKDELKRAANNPELQLHSFSLADCDEKTLGTFSLKDKPLKISTKSFLSFLSKLPGSPDTMRRVSDRFTVTEAAKLFLARVAHSNRIDPARFRKRNAEKRSVKFHYRQTGPWIFAFHKQMLRQVLFDKKAAAEPPPIKEKRKGRRRGQGPSGPRRSGGKHRPTHKRPGRTKDSVKPQ